MMHDPLTPREVDILRCLSRGLRNKEMAAELLVAESTVKTHVYRMLAKIGARNRTQAVDLGWRYGYLDGDAK